MNKRFSLPSIATLAASFALLFCLFPVPSSADLAYEFWVAESDEDEGTNAEFKRYWYEPSLGTATLQETYQVNPNLRGSGVSDRSNLVLSGDGASLSWNAFSTVGVSGQFIMSFDLADRTLSQAALIDTGSTLRSTWTPDAQSFYTVGLSGQASPGYVEWEATTWTNLRNPISYHAIGFYNDHLYLGRSAGSSHGVRKFDTPGLLTTGDNDITQLTGTGWNHNSGGYSDFSFLGENFLFTVTRSLNQIQVFKNENPEDASGWDLYTSVNIGANPQRMSILETGDGNAQIFFNINEEATNSRQLGTVPWEWNENTGLWEFGDVEILLDVGDEDRWFQGVAATAIISDPQSAPPPQQPDSDSYAVLAQGEEAEERKRSVLIVVDGLRPDYVTPELMPNVYQMGLDGVFGELSFAVFPTVTRVNAPSISTGSYPKTHGLMHNHMYHPAVGDSSFNTGRVDNLRRLDQATFGNLLTAPSLGEILDEHGMAILSVSTGGTGNTYLHNHRGKGRGIWQSGGLFLPPEAEQEALEVLGELPDAYRSSEATEWMMDAYLYHALGDKAADVTILWFGETDDAGHSHGVGAPETLAAVSSVDRQIGRMLEAHAEHGLTDQINIFLTSDHGFTQSTGRFRISSVLEAAGLADGARVVRNMIYLEDDSEEYVQQVIEALQRNENMGNIYMKAKEPGSPQGRLPGTLSTDLIQWNHERSADIIVSSAWSDEVNEYGWAGVTSRRGTATHGSDSPYDVLIPLVAYGPDIKRGLKSGVPTGNVDFAPTILHLHGLEPLASMDGRILYELLVDGPAPESIEYRTEIHRESVTHEDGFVYEAAGKTYMVDDTVYYIGLPPEGRGEN